MSHCISRLKAHDSDCVVERWTENCIFVESGGAEVIAFAERKRDNEADAVRWAKSLLRLVSVSVKPKF